MVTVLKDVEVSSLDTRKNDLSRTGHTDAKLQCLPSEKPAFRGE